jgi:eukaryotic-like serine/threonine-protein kinase
LFARNDTVGRQDIYLQDLSRGSTTRLTFDPAQDASALFSPDESQIVFYSNRPGPTVLYRKAASGAGSDEPLLNGDTGMFPDSWSRDGKYLLFDRVGDSTSKVDIWVLPTTGEPTPFAYLATEFEEVQAQFSPDGRWVAYTSNESGRSEVYVQSFPIGSGKWQISNAGGQQPQWRGDGNELFYLSLDRSVMSVSVTGGTTLEVSRPAALFQTKVPIMGSTEERNQYVPTQDGQRFLVNTLADTTTSQPLTLVLNWAADLKK